MENHKNFVIRIKKLIKEILVVAKEEGVGDDFTYIFCFGVNRKDFFHEIEYTAGYSWDVGSKQQFDELMTILDEAYEFNNDDSDGLFGNICLN